MKPRIFKSKVLRGMWECVGRNKQACGTTPANAYVLWFLHAHPGTRATRAQILHRS